MDTHHHPSRRPDSRSGNALLTAVIITALAGVIIATSADLSVASQRRVTVANHTSSVLAALDVVLARRQRVVIDMAAAGRPEDFASRTDNYGVDFVGSCEVRWKIEPIWAKAVDGTGTEFAVFENPPPEGATGAPANLIDNPSILYLYRIAAEARDNNQVSHDADNAANDRVRVSTLPGDFNARAQGVRYVSTTNSSVLKYLLYWAQRGPKGDLELSHGPATQLVGHIYSGGSTYLGSGTSCNDWLALKPSNGATTIGPTILSPGWTSGTAYSIGTVVKVGTLYYQAKDAHTATAANQPGSAGGTWKAYWEDVTACRLESADGVYRLSKQALFGAFNNYPMTGVAPIGFTVNGSYLLDAAARAGEKLGNPPTASYLLPDVVNYPLDVFNATYQGRVLNPARVKDELATRALAGADTQRVVNVAGSGGLTAVALRGVDELPAGAGTPPDNAGNDSRDATRVTTSTFQWATHSLNSAAPGFNRQVRTKTNGLAEQPLHSQFLGRPEEPQSLVYYDLDGDATTDEHEYAMPEFISTSGGTTTDLAQRLTPAAIGGVNLDSVENPGTYLREALGGSLHLARRADYRGWLVVNKDGTAPTADPIKGMGIVIRERPRPETAYFAPTALPGTSDPLYMPFAYGHVRASLWPMVACDVAAEMTNQGDSGISTWTNGFATTTVAGVLTTNTTQSYSSTPSASVTFKSGANPGPSWNGGSWDSGSGVQRIDYLTRDSWRFIAMGRPSSTGANGLNATIWNDSANTTWLKPFGGRPVHSYVDTTINAVWAGIPTGSTGVGTDRFAVRWRGFIKPRYTENYTFYANRSSGHCGVRVWVDDVLVIDGWSESTAEVASQGRPLAADQLYAITVEAYDGSGAFGLHVDWTSATQAREILPNDRLYTQTMPAGFDPATFTAVETSLDRISATSGKAGLMLRPDVGISQVQDGRNPYLALCYSPTRGIYAQIRGERSRISTGTQTGYFVGNANIDSDANGTFETPLSDANGETALAQNDATLQRTATLTPVLTSTGYAATNGSQRRYTVYTPGKDSLATAPAAIGSWPANSGPTQLSGGDWTDTSVSSKSPLQRTSDYPFSIPEGAVDRVWRGPVTLRAQRWCQEYSDVTLESYYRWHLGNTQPANDATQRFRWRGVTTTGAWPAGWPDKDTNVDDLDTSNSVKRLFLFADRTGNRTATGTFTGVNNLFSLGANYGNWYGYDNSTPAFSGNLGDIDAAGTDQGAIIYKRMASSANTGWVYWFTDSDTDGYQDGAGGTWDVSATNHDAKTVYYINTGGVDTRPKVYNGSTLVRRLTQAETLSLMDATYGPGHVAVTTLPTYPTFAAPDPGYATGDPVAATPTIPSPATGFTRLNADPTAATTTLTVAGINNGTRLYSVGDVLGVHSAAGSEYVAVTAVPTTTTVTVTRGVRGTVAVDHPNTALVSQLSMPVSMVGPTAITVGATTWSVRTLASTITIAAGDVLQVDSEQVLVTATTAAAGTVLPTITVLRARNGTVAATHAINAAICTPLPVMGTLTAAHTNAVTTLNMSSTARLAVDDVLQLGTELMQVTAVTSPTQATVVRGYGRSAAAAQATGTTAFLAVGKTFAVSRGRTVSFELNPWISAGAAPSDTWRGLGSTAPDTDDWGWTRDGDWGWYWSGVKAYAPWKNYWSTVTPIGTTGGIPSRAYDRTWTGPLTGTAPTVCVPSPATQTDTAFPTSGLATSGSFSDDQPVRWVSGTAYLAGDLVWNGNAMYKALAAHTAAAATTPGSGASWTTAWERTSVWLRIERVGTTSRVRMLYALGATRPAVAADWKPLLTTPVTATATAPQPGRADSDDADPRELQFDLAPWFTAGRATVAVDPGAGAALTITAPTTGAFAPGDVVLVGTEYMLITAGAGTTFTVRRDWGGTVNGVLGGWPIGTEVVQARWRGSDLLVGLCAQSGSSSTLMDVDASNLRIEQDVPANPEITATDWQQSSPYGAEDDTRYLCSQYQVFWGPYDITEDFFSYGQDGLNPRVATEEWIYNTRYFWSQSRWWEDNQEKDPNYIIPNNAGILSMRELLAKTNILSINMRALQDYLTSTALSTAISSRIAGVGPTQALLGADYTLRDRVRTEGLLIHASRYNRYPWNPNIKGQNPWMPGYPLGAASNAGGCAALPNGTGSGYTNAELAALDNSAPGYDRRTQFQTIRNLMNIINTANNVTATLFNDLMPFTLGASSTPGQLWRTPAIKPQDFHHAIRITDAQDIDWSYGTTDDYEAGGVSFFTPNQLYIKGNVNTTPHSVDFGGIAATKANKLGIYCDAAILLSNTYSDGPFRVAGLIMDYTSRIPIIGSGSLGMNQGTTGTLLPVASASTYQFALLTHTIPTTRDSVRLGEASSFVSTMQYLEDWSSKTMTFVGSVVAMDTRRYSNAYLLESPKYHGMSPFGWMTAGDSPLDQNAWVPEYSAAGSWPPANAAGWTVTNNGTNIAMSNVWARSYPYIQAIYGAPDRRLFYNPDFSYKPGQPPLMPFGTSAAGMGGWSRIVK